MGLPTILPSELYMTCPLDKAHRILRARIQFHLVKCVKNHTLEKKMRCPWNPIHIVDRFEYLDHCNRTCPDLTNAMGSKILLEEEAGRDVGSIPVNATNALLPACTEDWDASPCFVGTYDPLKRTEGQPILRSSIGLSKAKRKEFTLQERRRHQQLEDVLPIEIKQSSKSVKQIVDIKPCRPPRKQPMAISAEVSMADDLNSSKFSDDGDRSINFPSNRVRQPHTPSSAITYEAVDDYAFSSFNGELNRKVTLFDAAYDDTGDNDARSCVSSISTQSSNIEALRNFIRKQKTFASVASSNSKETSKYEMSVNLNEINLQDEAANFPSIVPTSSSDNDDNDETLEQLNQRFANLSSMEKKIEKEKAQISQRLSQCKKKMVNSETSNVANLINGNDSKNSDVQDEAAASTEKKNNDDDSSVVKDQNGFISVNRRKCAANFGKSSKLQNPAVVGAGRGIVLDYKAYKNPRPVGNRAVHEDTEKTHETDETEEKETGSFYGYNVDD